MQYHGASGFSRRQFFLLRLVLRRTFLATGLVFQIALRQLPKQYLLNKVIHYRFLVFCLALRAEAGAFEWRPSCDEPWTGANWREALQKAASAALNKDPSYVS